MSKERPISSDAEVHYRSLMAETMSERKLTRDDVDAVVFCNASGRTVRDDFQPVIESLEGQDIECIIIDSGDNDLKDITYAEEAQEIVDLLNARDDIKKVGFAGRSRGGYDVLEVLHNGGLEKEVAFAVLVSTPVGTEHSSPLLKGLVNLQLTVPESFSSRLIRGVARVAQELPFDLDPHQRMDMLADQGVHNLGRVYENTLRYDWQKRVNELPPNMPIALVTNVGDSLAKASGDAMVPIEGAPIRILRPYHGHGGTFSPQEFMQIATYCIDRHPKL